MAVYTEVPDDELAAVRGQLWSGRPAVLQGHRRGRGEHQLSRPHREGAALPHALREAGGPRRSALLPRPDGAPGQGRHQLPDAGARSRGPRCCARSPAGRPRSSRSSRASGSAGRSHAHCGPWARPWPRLHLAGRELRSCRRPNALGLAGWRPLLRPLRGARRRDCARPCRRPSSRSSTTWSAHWPRDLPQASSTPTCFPTTCSFSATRLSGLIDFYFACNDALAYDIAVGLNAWCFEADHAFNVTKGRALLKGYQSVRPLKPAERDALPLLARGAALRFLLTRAYDWLHTAGRRARQRKDPLEYLRRLKFHRGVSSPTSTAREPSMTPTAMTSPSRKSSIYTDGACSGNPGPGGWGAILMSRARIARSSAAASRRPPTTAWS